MRFKRATPSYRLICMVLAAVLLLALAVPGLAEHQWSDQIRSFERIDPVYDEAVELGTAQESLHLPDTLRAIVDIPEELDVTTFVQAAPEADTSDGSTSFDYYWYGYVAPQDADALVEAGEKAIYTIYYADGQLAYRLYGSIAGSENLWFACDEAGNITGAVLDIPVTWSGSYDGETAGTYTFTASVSAESPYHWSGSAPSAQIYVLSGSAGEEHEAEPVCTCGAQPGEDGVTVHAEDCPLYVVVLTDCHCGSDGEAIDTDNFPWAHQEDCRYFSPVECMCRELVETEIEDYDGHTGEYLGTHTEYVPGDFSHVHDASNVDCPLYGCDTVRFRKLATGEESVMTYDDASRIIAFQNRTAGLRASQQPARAPAAATTGEDESLYPALGRIELISGSEQITEVAVMAGSAFSLYAAGASEQAMDAIVKDQNILPTSGNESIGSTPGTWLDYVRTRFRNIYDDWKWASNPSSYNNWKFSGRQAGSTSGTVQTNSLRSPNRVNGRWDVYSGEQLRYALSYYSNGDTIYLNGNLNLDGTNANWAPLTFSNNGVTLDGGGHTIYNLGMLTNEHGYGALCAAKGSTPITIQNLTFSNAKVVFHVRAKNESSPGSADGGAGRTGLFAFSGRNARFEAVHIKNSLFAQTSPTKKAHGGLGAFGFIVGGRDNLPVISKCSVQDTVVGGLGHPGAFTTFADKLRIEWSCALNNRIFSLAGDHGGLFVSCNAHPCYISNCISSGEMYSASNSGGFIGSCRGGTIENCAATGKLETYLKSGGFAADATGAEYIKNCYTTVLVGLRSDVKSMGGFIRDLWSNKNLQIENCYAAGEVGDFSLDLSNSDGCGSGGFSDGMPSSTNPCRITNCYYDKQTTAMREWVSGSQKTLSGVTGLLTSTSPKNVTTENPNGYGMASGENFGLGPTGWTYTARHYPQLDVFAKATAANWGSAAVASLVRAASSASTATVFLNTWGEGYDWDEYGVRSMSPESYSREPNGVSHRADKFTYDTVREIISPFTVTNGTWSELIPGGAKTKMVLVGALQGTKSQNVVIEGSNGTVKGPGMNWFSVTNADPQSSGASLSRPLRLIGYMSIDAGSDRTESNAVEDGRTYDHRKGVTLTMMDEITDNLVVGINDDDFWSTAKRAGYPTVSDDDPAWSTGFYGVPTDHTNHLATRFSASKDAILNTEIWRVDKDSAGNYIKNPDGTYQTTYSVKVTGEGTSGGTSGTAPTKDERKWVGTDHFSVFEKQMYVVSYYWQLTDGRYVTDSKLVEIVPSNRHLQVDVTGAGNLPSSTALQVDAYRGDTTKTVSSSPARSSHKQDGIPVAEPSTAVWKKVNPGTTLDQLTIQMEDNMGTSHGSATINKETIRKVTTTNPAPIWVTVTYSYTTDVEQTGSTTQKYREETVETTAKVRYDLCMALDGSYYIQFNRSYAEGAATPGGTVMPAASGGSLTGLKFEPMHYNVHVVVHVVENAYLTVKKVVTGYTDLMKEQTFTIDLSGAAVSQVNLHHNETSKTIAVPITAASNDVTITERLPMEFSQQRITLNSTKGTAELNDNVLTLHAGDEVTVTVTNRYDGKGYFKSRTQANNTFMPAS